MALPFRARVTFRIRYQASPVVGVLRIVSNKGTDPPNVGVRLHICWSAICLLRESATMTQGSVPGNHSSQHTLGLDSLSAAVEPIWVTDEGIYTSTTASASAGRDGVADCDGATGDSARAGLSETLLAVRPAGWVL